MTWVSKERLDIKSVISPCQEVFLAYNCERVQASEDDCKQSKTFNKMKRLPPTPPSWPMYCELLITHAWMSLGYKTCTRKEQENLTSGVHLLDTHAFRQRL